MPDSFVFPSSANVFAAALALPPECPPARALCSSRGFPCRMLSFAIMMTVCARCPIGLLTINFWRFDPSVGGSCPQVSLDWHCICQRELAQRLLLERHQPCSQEHLEDSLIQFSWHTGASLSLIVLRMV